VILTEPERLDRVGKSAQSVARSGFSHAAPTQNGSFSSVFFRVFTLLPSLDARLGRCTTVAEPVGPLAPPQLNATKRYFRYLFGVTSLAFFDMSFNFADILGFDCRRR